MSALLIHPENQDQETAIKIFLDALHVSYKTAEKDMDETEYLLASSVMKERLDKAVEQEKNGEGVKINLDDIWK